ncbi:MAG: cell division protein FtsQ/DivIB [Candidatus Anammoxibacter sp.]
MWCGVTAIVSSLFIFGLYKGFGFMLKQEEFKITTRNVSLTLPGWISEQGKEKVYDLVLSQREQNQFSRNLTDNIASAYKQNPLYKRVVSVKREFPNKIKVALELRKPVAVIKSKRKRFLVDGSGVRLPAKYYNWPNSNEYSVNIVVNKLKDIPSNGKAWKDKRVLAGVDLVNFLRKNNADKLLAIESIDVSNVGKRFFTKKSDIILLTRSGTRIKWGCSTLCRELNELSDAEKLRNLYSVARIAGKDFLNMEYVDVRWTKPVGKM